MDKITVSVIGAGGKMGTRTSNNLAKQPERFELLLSEASEAGIASIKERGFEPVPAEEALKRADIVVFAVPDTLIKKLSEIYVPQLRPGAGFIILDRLLLLQENFHFGMTVHLQWLIRVIRLIFWIRIPMRHVRTGSAAAEGSRTS